MCFTSLLAGSKGSLNPYDRLGSAQFLRSLDTYAVMLSL